MELRARPAESAEDPRPAGSVSVEQDSLESLNLNDDLVEQRLTAEDMADDDELAELRDLEARGASKTSERRR